MTSQTNRTTGWRRAVTSVVASGALAAGLMVGLGTPAALADPDEPTTGAEAPQAMTADEALAIIRSDYDLGAGGGELSTLIHQVLKLRSQGYLPSNGNKKAIEAALDKRPNQAPLIEALEETLAYQKRNQLRGQAPTLNPPTIGINQLPPRQQQTPTNPDDSGVYIGPGGEPAGPGTINVPLG